MTKREQRERAATGLATAGVGTGAFHGMRVRKARRYMQELELRRAVAAHNRWIRSEGTGIVGALPEFDPAGEYKLELMGEKQYRGHRLMNFGVRKTTKLPSGEIVPSGGHMGGFGVTVDKHGVGYIGMSPEKKLWIQGSSTPKQLQGLIKQMKEGEFPVLSGRELVRGKEGFPVKPAKLNLKGVVGIYPGPRLQQSWDKSAKGAYAEEIFSKGLSEHNPKDLLGKLMKWIGQRRASRIVPQEWGRHLERMAHKVSFTDAPLEVEGRMIRAAGGGGTGPVPPRVRFVTSKWGRRLLRVAKVGRLPMAGAMIGASAALMMQNSPTRRRPAYA